MNSALFVIAVAFTVSVLFTIFAAWLAIRGIKKEPPVSNLRVVCKWYHEERFLEGNPFSTRISHGMCPECAARFRKETEALKPVLSANPQLIEKV